MKKRTIALRKKLVLGKEIISGLGSKSEALVKGGSDTCDCPVLTPYQTLICPSVTCNSAAQNATTCCGK